MKLRKFHGDSFVVDEDGNWVYQGSEYQAVDDSWLRLRTGQLILTVALWILFLGIGFQNTGLSRILSVFLPWIVSFFPALWLTVSLVGLFRKKPPFRQEAYRNLLKRPHTMSLLLLVLALLGVISGTAALAVQVGAAPGEWVHLTLLLLYLFCCGGLAMITTSLKESFYKV